jgi:ribosome maturation factor RimP
VTATFGVLLSFPAVRRTVSVGLRPLFILESVFMDKLAIAAKLTEIAERIVTSHKLELVRAEAVGAAKNPTVRIFIDRPEGVSHEDCAVVSREVGEVLDQLDFISDAYILEVSSPGLERELYDLKDFEKFTGSLAKVRTRVAVGGQRNFRGRIKAVENGEIVFSDKTAGEVRFGFGSVAKANLEIDIEEEFRRAKG